MTMSWCRVSEEAYCRVNEVIDGRCADITGVQVAPISTKDLNHHNSQERTEQRRFRTGNKFTST